MFQVSDMACVPFIKVQRNTFQAQIVKTFGLWHFISFEVYLPVLYNIPTNLKPLKLLKASNYYRKTVNVAIKILAIS